jgi:hypothetical protein
VHIACHQAGYGEVGIRDRYVDVDDANAHGKYLLDDSEQTESLSRKVKRMLNHKRQLFIEQMKYDNWKS